MSRLNDDVRNVSAQKRRPTKKLGIGIGKLARSIFHGADQPRPRQNASVSTTAHRKIVLFGLFGGGNLGNEATLWVTLHHLRRRLPDAEFACVCDSVPEFAKEYGVVGLPFDPMPLRGERFFRLKYLITEPIRHRRAVRMLADADQFVVVGTGVLDDLGEVPWGMPAHILRWTSAARASHATGHLLAVGAGPIHNRMSRVLMARAVSNAAVRSYRDDYSRNYMTKLGVQSDSDEVVPDLAFALPREWLLSPMPIKNPPRVIGVGVMSYFGWNVGWARGRDIHSRYITKMATGVRRLLDAGYHVRLIIGERRTDAQTVSELLEVIGRDELAKAGNRLIVPKIDSVHDVLREIALTDIIVASRFHNLVFALVLGRPVVSIGYSAKFEALMQEMGLGRYCQSIEDINLDRLCEHVQHLACNHVDAVATITMRTNEYRKRLERLYDATFGRA